MEIFQWLWVEVSALCSLIFWAGAYAWLYTAKFLAFLVAVLVSIIPLTIAAIPLLLFGVVCTVVALRIRNRFFCEQLPRAPWE